MTTQEVTGGAETSVASQFGREEVRAAVVGALLGGTVGGLLLYMAAPNHLLFVGETVGAGSPLGGLLVWLALAVVLGFGFAYAVGQTINDYVASVIGLTSRNPTARRALQPLLRRSALGTTAGGMGLTYGLVAGIVVGSLLVPAVAGATTQWSPSVPAFNGTVVGIYALYGLLLGVGYGAVLEGSVSAGGRRGAVVLSSLLGGLVGAAVLYQLARAQLIMLGAVAGAPSAGRGLAVWFVLALVLGVLYRYAVTPALAQDADYVRTSAVAGLVFGVVAAVVFGMLLVPLLVRSATGYAPALPLVKGKVLLAYLAFGVTVGTAYAAFRSDRSLGLSVGGGRATATLASTLVGGLVGGAYLYQSQTLHLRFLGQVANSGSPTRGLTVFLVLALLFGGALALVADGRLRRSALPLGVGYGVLYAVVVGLVLTPVLVNARSAWELAVPLGNESVAVGYFLYGLLFPLVYSRVRRVESASTVDDTALPAGPSVGQRTRALLFGGLFGGMVGGLVAHHLAGPVYLRYVGVLGKSSGSITRSWLVWLALSLLLAALFSRWFARTGDDYVQRLVGVTARNPNLRRPLQPLLRRAALTTTATGMGAIFGVALAVVLGMIGVPLLVSLLSQWSMALPTTEPFFLLGFVVYGTVLGAAYGVVTEF